MIKWKRNKIWKLIKTCNYHSIFYHNSRKYACWSPLIPLHRSQKLKNIMLSLSQCSFKWQETLNYKYHGGKVFTIIMSKVNSMTKPTLKISTIWYMKDARLTEHNEQWSKPKQVKILYYFFRVPHFGQFLINDIIF